MERKMKQCPYCGEMIPAEAKKCRYCGEWLETTSSPQAGGEPTRQPLNEVNPEPKKPEPEPEKHEPKEEKQPEAKLKAPVGKEGSDNAPDNQPEEEPEELKSDPAPDSWLDAIKRCYRKFNIFEGRAMRKEFWWFMLYSVIAGIVLNIIIHHIQSDYIKCVFYLIWLVVIYLPFVAVGTRRFHDIGKSAAWWLIIFVPIVGPIIPYILWARRSDVDNRFGTDPETNSAEEEQPVTVSKRDIIASNALLLGTVVVVGGILLIAQHFKNESYPMPQNTEYGIGIDDNDSTNISSYDEVDEDYAVPSGTYIGYLTIDGAPSQDVRLKLSNNGENFYSGYFLFEDGQESYCEGDVGGAHMNLQLEGIGPEREAFTLTVGMTDNPGELSGVLLVERGDYQDEYEVTLNLEQ